MKYQRSHVYSKLRSVLCRSLSLSLSNLRKRFGSTPERITPCCTQFTYHFSQVRESVCVQTPCKNISQVIESVYIPYKAADHDRCGRRPGAPTTIPHPAASRNSDSDHRLLLGLCLLAEHAPVRGIPRRERRSLPAVIIDLGEPAPDAAEALAHRVLA